MYVRQSHDRLPRILGMYTVPGEDISGSHQVHVTRGLQGEFNVFFDSSLIITVTDNTITSSDRIFFGSMLGDSTFDNISVSDTVEDPSTTTAKKGPGFELEVVVLRLSLFFLFTRKRRR